VPYRFCTLVAFLTAGLAVAAAGQQAGPRLPSRAELAAPPTALDAASPRTKDPAAAEAHEFESTLKPFIKSNCLTCHSARRKKGGLNLEQYQSIEAVTEDADRWETVIRKLREGEMPPAEEEPRPEPAAVEAVTGFVERAIARADAARGPMPGRVTARRLNRSEYNNTVRDLLGLDLRLADSFPQDDSGYGFDNIGDVLSLSPILMEKYLAAAEQIARTAVFGPEPLKPALTKLQPLTGRIQPNPTPQRDYDVTGLTLPNALHATPRIPVDGEYVIRLVTSGGRPVGSDPIRFGLWIDGRQVTTHEIDPEGGASFEPDQQQELAGRRLEFRTRLTAGEHWVAGTVLNLFEGLPPSYNGPNPAKRPQPPPPVFKPRPNSTPQQIAEQKKRFDARVATTQPANTARVGTIEIIGPYGHVAGASAESRRKLYACGHVDGRHQSWCSTRIVANLARRAYRRPVARAEVDRLLALSADVRRRGGSFEEGLAATVQAVLVSPDFLFRIERGQPVAGASPALKLTSHELATRLSYFLWASMPDDELMAAADRRTLHTPRVLAAQVRRMLADPRASSLAEHFAGQWLQVRALESATPDREKFPDFDHYLRVSMRRETELFFQSIVREDRSVLDFIDAPYTFLNERLARHYGVPDVKGPEFRRVALAAAGERGGVVTQASVLTVSSYATRTSPVLRGKWILDNLLDAPPPEPPPDVPNLDDKAVGTAASLRQQLEQHRADPTCASCHKRMDPLGFGLENFDAVGAWRVEDGKFAIDASGTLPDGRTFTGPRELKAILRTEREAFARGLTSKLMTYALGRGLERYDRPAIKAIVNSLPADDYRFSSVVRGIVTSPAFQMRGPEKTKPIKPPTPTELAQ
jgi:mono/diheme cytochrome c family protein